MRFSSTKIIATFILDKGGSNFTSSLVFQLWHWCIVSREKERVARIPYLLTKKETLLRGCRGLLIITVSPSKSKPNKRIFSWAYEYEKIKTNPTLGVKKLLVKAHQHYAEGEDYQFMLKIAAASPYWYAPICMEIAYLCRMRLSEVLDMTDGNELTTGLLIKRAQGFTQ